MPHLSDKYSFTIPINTFYFIITPIIRLLLWGGLVKFNPSTLACDFGTKHLSRLLTHKGSALKPWPTTIFVHASVTSCCCVPTLRQRYRHPVISQNLQIAGRRKVISNAGGLHLTVYNRAHHRSCNYPSELWNIVLCFIMWIKAFSSEVNSINQSRVSLRRSGIFLYY